MNSVKDKWILKEKMKHFNDLGYQQEIDVNAKIANSEQNPGPVSKHSIKFFKYFNNFLKKK